MDEMLADVDMKPSLDSIDTKQVTAKWIKEYLDGVLSLNHFQDYWKRWVPRLYSPTLNESCLNWSFNEDDTNRIMFTPLEEFICNGDPAVVLAAMTQLDKPPSVCGRVFKLGEPTYSCRECGMDNTCVLCVSCFKQSQHRFHKYKMGTSTGGGCCDCGDKEAWKKAPFCDIHIAGTIRGDADEAAVDDGGGGIESTTTTPTATAAASADDASKGLPEHMAERTRIAFDAVLWYAYSLLTSEYSVEFISRLPDENMQENDSYCTILYNDEVHTFEQVIGTINRVIKCSQRNSIEYVTNIDREGRAVVKCSDIQHCNEVKSQIESITSRHSNKPLKVIVVHSYIVAHQIFAMKLLSWLQAFLAHGEAFRAIFTEVVLRPRSGYSILKGIMTSDSQLWKSARTHWHRLLISGMLLEYENKKALAKVFTKNYGSVMKDYIKDDHDHSFSISSLAVQLFTVPTLAHHLIANDDALFILLNTFISECSRKCNAVGKLEFEKNVSIGNFKRAQYILYDLRYLLSSIPDKWTDDMRRSFLQGLSILLNLITMMQGMDPVTRQIGQHMEYEPEWESPFNLHIKLAYCISLVLKWCGTDKVVLVKAYRLTLKKLQENPCYDPNEQKDLRELCNYSVMCLNYDVSTKPVSIHLTLSRFLAGLHLHLEKFELSFDGPEFDMPKPNPVQLIEPVLRTQVMISQVHAGMWRRNGYALLNQLYFYHNVKCRTEMLDRDVTLLQVGASLIESNEFLIHLLNKFNLINWANSGFESVILRNREDDSTRQTIYLLEEFLQLLIVIIGERYIPGVSNITTEDRIKKEIIQHLCIKPLPHSELNKTIPDDLTHETGLDDVIEELAVFKKPNQTYGKGVYELKNIFFNEYNVFYYHYTREELSKSEEEQRKRRTNAGELECCPPPQLPKLNPSFNMIVNLLQCDVMLFIMQTVLTRANNLRAMSFSEPQVHKTLHLIGYALQEEESKNYPFLLFSEKAVRYKIPSLVEELLSCPRVEAHKALVKWVLRKFKDVLRTDESTASTSNTTEVTEKRPLDKSDDEEKERRAKKAAERRARIMAQMTAMQNNFIKENAQMFEEATSEMNRTETTSSIKMDTSLPIDEEPTALGPNQSTRLNVEKQLVCILCQEEQMITADGPTMVLAAFVHQATVLCQNRGYEEIMDVSKQDPLYLHANLGPAPHTSTCGHVMHSACWQKYFDNVRLKEHRRPYRLRHPASFDVDKQEFLCPLCECLSNTVLPLVPSLSTIQTSYPKNRMAFDDWLFCIQTTTSKKLKVCHGTFKCQEDCSNAHCNACENASNSGTEPDSPIDSDSATCTIQMHQVYQSSSHEHLKQDFGDKAADFLALFPPQHSELSSSLKEMIQLYTQVTYTRGLNLNPHPSDRRLAPMAWKSCSYTIHSIETILRESKKPLLGSLSSRQRDCLESLVRIMGVLGRTWPRSIVISSHGLRLLSILLEVPDKGPSILQWDTFGFLIPLTFSLPSLFSLDEPAPIPTGGTLELHTLRLMFISHIVKILIQMDMKEVAATGMETEDEDEQGMNGVFDVLKLMRKQVENVSGRAVWSRVQEACIPFLRCCVLFYHFLTDVPAPSALLESGGDTFETMCAYLDLAREPNQLFGSARVLEMVERWIRHEDVQMYLLDKTSVFAVKEPLKLNHLVELPQDYSELINTVSSFTCPNSDHEDSRNPTMCLVCGEVLCSQSYCCQTELNKVIIGACNYHAHRCGAGVGIFLRVRECEVMFLASPHRGCYVSPPYLDNYGETDQGLRRGNPLHLCQERYKKLQTQWLSHSIHEEIARYIESSNNIVPAQWQHL
ncbi:PREDICTED: E3 ubiquitin-protein ligase UBR2 isoform X2 [Nicrophorus vespilloides]|nr:PREDICTED: E3 ubiquitin-protein ligase UBR2 isoform X2 [Nicrophorus vespilloides]